MTRRATLAVCLVALLVGPMAGASAGATSGVASDDGTTPRVSVGTAPTGSASSVGTAPTGSAGNEPTGPALGDGRNETVGPSTSGSAKVSSRLQRRLETAEGRNGGTISTARTASDTVAVVVEAKLGSGAGVADRVGRAGGTVVARSGRLVEAEMPAAAVDALANAEGVDYVRAPIRPSASTVESEGVGPVNATWAHDRNITGANVTVAVIDIGGFNLTNPEIRDQITASRDFTGQGIGNGTTAQHGTGVAEIVADTAPGAGIVPVHVNSLVQWQNAVDYIRDDTSADVVVMSLAWYGVGPLDGTSDMNRRISRLRDDGVLWVNAAGNMGDRRHWNGTWHDPDADGWMNFAGTDETLTLTGGTTASVVVNWNDWAARNDDYDLYVLNDSGGVIGSSGNRQNGVAAPPVESYADGGLPSTIHLAIKRVDATGDADFDIWFRGNYRPEYWTAERSLVNPAVGPNVTAVGAVPASDTTAIESFSSRGPTIDGRLKPDLVAPDGVSTSTYDGAFDGTSAAAPHAGGVAALLLGVNESMGPSALEHVLRTTATDVSETAPDTDYGYGLVDAAAAIGTQPAVAEPNRTAVAFGSVRLSETATRTVSVTNLGGRPLHLTDATIDGANATAYAVTAGGRGVVDVGQSHEISVAMDSQRRGDRNATLRLTHNGTDGETTVALAGRTVAPDVTATPATTVDFGSVALRTGTGTASVAVENNGTAALNVTDATLSGADASAFAVASTGHEPPTVLAPGETATYDLTASVTDPGVLNATLALRHNVTDRPALTRSLTATGVDRNPPELTSAHTAAEGENATVLGRAGTATVSVTAADESGVDTVTVNATPLGGSTVRLSPGGGDWYNATVAVDAANATEGAHRLTVTATDELGQVEATETTPVTLDLTNATLVVETPATGRVQNTTTVDVSASASDTVTAVSTVETRLDGGSWHSMTESNGTWDRTLSGLADGSHTIALRSTDAGGNTGPVRTRSLTVDTTGPTIREATLNRTRDIRPESPLSVGVEASDDRAGVARVRAAGTLLASSATQWTGAVDAASALGQQSVAVTVVDDAGNRARTTLPYRVGRNATLSAVNGTMYEATTEDSAIDAVRIDSDSDLSNQTVTVGTAARNPTADGLPSGVGLAYPQVETSVSNANVTNATIRLRIPSRTLSDRHVAPETVTFWAHDGAGWNRTRGRLDAETSDTYHYTVYTDHFSAFAVAGEVEDTPPTIESVAPTDGTTVSTTGPTVEARYADAFSGVDAGSVSLTVDGTVVTDGLTTSASSVSYTPTLSSGTHTATVRVADAAGNVGARTWSFTVSEPAATGGGGGGGGGGSASSSAGDDDSTESPTATLTGTNPNVTVGGRALSEVGFTSRTELLTGVAVTELTESPAAEPSNTSFVAGADIGFPNGGSGPVRFVRLTLQQSRLDELGVSAEQLAIYHMDGATSQWDGLETTVIGQHGDSVTVEAPSAGFSVYAVFAATPGTEPTPTAAAPTAAASDNNGGESDTATPTPGESDTATPGSSDTATTGGSGPGFTIGLSLVVLLVVAATARYRR